MYVIANRLTPGHATDREFCTPRAAQQWLNRNRHRLPGRAWTIRHDDGSPLNERETDELYDEAYGED